MKKSLIALAVLIAGSNRSCLEASAFTTPSQNFQAVCRTPSSSEEIISTRKSFAYLRLIYELIYGALSFVLSAIVAIIFGPHTQHEVKYASKSPKHLGSNRDGSEDQVRNNVISKNLELSLKGNACFFPLFDIC